jgi:hypothetical protein
VAGLAFLPRTFPARTAHGTAFYWDRELDLLARDERTGRGLGQDELRRVYPDAWWTWTRFAAFLPPGATGRLSHPGGGLRPSMARCQQLSGHSLLGGTHTGDGGARSRRQGAFLGFSQPADRVWR